MKKQHLTAFWLSLLMTIVWVLPAFTIHAEAVQLLSIDVAAPMEVFQGESITVRASGSGGTAPYQYYFSYKINNGNWTTLRNYSSVSSVSLTTSTAGNYTMRSFVRDAGGQSVYCDLSVQVREPYVTPSNISTVSSTVIQKGGTVTVKGLASGGTKPYQFKYYYVDQRGMEHIVKDYSTTASVPIKFNTPGYYTIHCTLKDKDGKVLDKAFNITVQYATGRAISNSSTLSTYSTSVDINININASANGGTQPYQYEYYYSTNGSTYIKLSSYTKTSKKTIQFSEPGYIKVKVIAKDLNGNTSQAVKSITVKNNTHRVLALNSSVSTTNLVEKNTNIVIKASGTGGIQPYRFAFQYRTTAVNGN